MKVSMIDYKNLLVMFETHSLRITKLCLKLCANKIEADDLFQETWLRVLKYYDKYDDSKPFDKWCCTICINAYKTIYNANKKLNSHNILIGEDEEVYFKEAVHEDKELDEECTKVKEIVDELKEKHKIVVVLFYYQEYSITEIGQILNLPAGTVKSRLFEARKIIKRRLENSER